LAQDNVALNVLFLHTNMFEHLLGMIFSVYLACWYSPHHIVWLSSVDLKVRALQLYTSRLAMALAPLSMHMVVYLTERVNIFRSLYTFPMAYCILQGIWLKYF